MISRVLFSADSGKGNTKYCFEDNSKLLKGIFATRGRELREEEDAELNDNNFVIEFEGTRWGLGDSYQIKDNNNSKNTDIHKIAIYTAITESITSGTTHEIILTVTAPATLANNKEAKAEFVNNLKGSINIKVNGKDYSFIISKVAVKAEATGALYKETSLFKDKNVLSVDLGYLNLNACAINRMKIMDSVITDVIGMQKLHSMLNDALNKYNEGRKISTQKLNDALDNGVYKKGRLAIEETKQRVKAVKEDFLKEVITVLQEKYFFDDYDLVVFSGATSEVIKDTIEATIDNAYIIEDSQYANVVGNYNWMKAKLS